MLSLVKIPSMFSVHLLICKCVSFAHCKPFTINWWIFYFIEVTSETYDNKMKGISYVVSSIFNSYFNYSLNNYHSINVLSWNIFGDSWYILIFFCFVQNNLCDKIADGRIFYISTFQNIKIAEQVMKVVLKFMTTFLEAMNMYICLTKLVN